MTIEEFLWCRARVRATTREGTDGIYRMSDFKELHDWADRGILPTSDDFLTGGKA